MKISFAIIGCGHIARRHAQHIINHPESELIGVHDKDENKCALFADEYQTKAFSFISDLLESDCHIVVICTPSGLHKEHTLAAFKAYKNVLVEKPMALNYSDAS